MTYKILDEELLNAKPKSDFFDAAFDEFNEEVRKFTNGNGFISAVHGKSCLSLKLHVPSAISGNSVERKIVELGTVNFSSDCTVSSISFALQAVTCNDYNDLIEGGG